MEGFFPAGWNLEKIDACVDPDPSTIGVRQKNWHKHFQPVPCGSLADFDGDVQMGRLLSDRMECRM
jgi:glucosamine-6-phosphate deaminase